MMLAWRAQARLKLAPFPIWSSNAMTSGQSAHRRRRSARIPSVYRYMLLGLILPILVFAGMTYGYNYGQAFGDLGAAVFAGVGSLLGLLLATAIIIRVSLFWDRALVSRTRSSIGNRPRKKK